MPYNIVRPGMTSWSSKTGILTDTDWLSRLIRGISYIRAAPVSSSTLSIVPVDFMGKMISVIALRKFEIMKKDYNIFNFPPSHVRGLLKLIMVIANDLINKKCPVKDPKFVDGFKDIFNTVSQSVWNDVVTNKLNSVERGSHDEDIISGLRMFYNGIPSEETMFSPSSLISCPVEYPWITREYMEIMIKNNTL